MSLRRDYSCHCMHGYNTASETQKLQLYLRITSCSPSNTRGRQIALHKVGQSNSKIFQSGPGLPLQSFPRGDCRHSRSCVKVKRKTCSWSQTSHWPFLVLLATALCWGRRLSAQFKGFVTVYLRILQGRDLSTWNHWESRTYCILLFYMQLLFVRVTYYVMVALLKHRIY